MNNNTTAVICRIHLTTIFVCIFSIFITFRLEAQENYPLTFRSELSIDSQGFRFSNGFDAITMKQQPDALSLKLSGKGKPSICSYFTYLNSRDSGKIEITAKVILSNKKNGTSPIMRIAWPWGKRPEGYCDIQLIADGKFYTYKINLNERPEWKSKKLKKGPIKIYPCISPGNSGIEIDIASIEAKLTPKAELTRIKKIAEERLTAQELLINALKQHKIPCRTVADAIIKIRARITHLKDSKEPVSTVLEKFDKLEKSFTQVYRPLSLYRRFLEGTEDFEAMKRTAPASSETTAYQKELQQIKRLLAKSDFSAAEKMLSRTEEEAVSRWNRILRKPIMQAGLDQLSFGRFGWVWRGDCGLLVNQESREKITRTTFRDANRSHPALIIKPSDAEYIGGSAKHISSSWVSDRWNWKYKAKSGNKIFWTRIRSLVAPGSLIKTDAKAVDITLVTDKFSAPYKIAGVFNGKLRQFTPQQLANVNWSRLSENWLLLFSGSEYLETPWLLTLQKRPDKVSYSDDSIILHRSNGIGVMGISSPWGLQPLPPGFATGNQALSEKSLRLVKTVNNIMTCYPERCEESFEIDNVRRTVRIVNRFGYYRVKNDWNHPGIASATIPPLLMLAHENGYPVILPRDFHAIGLMTKYGQYAYVSGHKSSYSLPIPNLNSEILPDTPWYAKRKTSLNKFAKTFLCAKPQGSNPDRIMRISCLSPYFEAWAMLDAENRIDLCRNMDLYIKRIWDAEKQLGTFRGSFGSHTLVSLGVSPGPLYSFEALRGGSFFAR